MRLALSGRSEGSSSKNRITTAAGMAVESLESRRLLAYTLDPSYGTGGIVITDAGDSGYSEAKDTLMQPDERVVVAGHALVGEMVLPALVRYNTDGTLDATFGNGGVVTQDLGSNATIDNIEYANGKIIAAGSLNTDATADAFVMRLNSDGTLDTTFGDSSSGIAVLPIQSAFSPDVAVRPDGSVLVAYYLPSRVVQLDPSGQLDTGWAEDGYFTVENSNTAIEDMALQPDGALLLGGTTDTTVAGEKLGMIMRLDTAGAVDATFGDAGMAITGTSTDDQIWSIAVDGAGNIVASGHTLTTSPSNALSLGVWRFESDGDLDGTFGNAGATSVVDSEYWMDGWDVVIDGDGRIVIGGYAYIFPYEEIQPVDVLTARLNPDGTPDESFASGGYIITELSELTDNAWAVGVQSDGKIVVGGLTGGFDVGTTSFFAMRFTAPPVEPPTGPVFVDENGNLVIESTANNDTFQVLPDAEGVRVIYNGQDMGVFAPTGQILVGGGDGNDQITINSAVALDAVIDGGNGNDIIVGGGGDDIITGGDGIDLLEGGAGSDIVSGGEGLDIVSGGAGRDLIIGGDGSDLLVGNADQDILIAGTTNLSQADLLAVRDEWNGAGTYAQRVAALQGGGGVNLISGVTVFDDGDIDILVGGAATDWFLYNYDGSLFSRDLVLDRLGSEARTEID